MFVVSIRPMRYLVPCSAYGLDSAKHQPRMDKLKVERSKRELFQYSRRLLSAKLVLFILGTGLNPSSRPGLGTLRYSKSGAKTALSVNGRYVIDVLGNAGQAVPCKTEMKSRFAHNDEYSGHCPGNIHAGPIIVLVIYHPPAVGQVVVHNEVEPECPSSLIW